MRVPISWLQEYLGLEISRETIEIACTDIGIEVDLIEELTSNFQGVIAGKIVQLQPHPKNPHALFLVDVLVEENRIVQVVTSDRNCHLGMVAPIALVGSIVNGVTIEAAEFFGSTSFGMLLSEKELSLGDEDDRVLEISSSYLPGMDLSFLGKETLFHISLTPNLGHCLSICGLAREIAAKLSLPLKKEWNFGPTTQAEFIQYFSIPEAQERWNIKLLAGDACPYYSLLTLENIPVIASPYLWKRRLFLSGMRSINLIVDALNLVMLEIGQPMHAFDSKAFSGSKEVVVSVQNRSKGKLLLLNDQEKEILEGTLTISNCTQKILAIAGVMGAKEGSVELKGEFQSIFVESAYFSMSAVRKSRKNIDCSSESSRRFERGVDPKGPIRAQFFLIKLLQQVLPHFSIAAFNVTMQEDLLPKAKMISLRLSRASMLLGFSVDRAVAEDIFERLSYPYEWIEPDTLQIAVPSYRHDVGGEVDLIEEIAKLKGFASFDIAEIPKCRVTTQRRHHLYEQEKRARNALVSLGLQECSSSSLISPQSVLPILGCLIPKNAIISVQNPMSQDQSILRPTLLPSLLDALQRNLAFRQSSLSLFEVGTVFLRTEGVIQEKKVVSILLYGENEPHHPLAARRDFDFYDMKGIWEDFSRILHLQDIEIDSSKEDLYHPGRQASLTKGGQRVGLMGGIHPKMAQKFDIPKGVYFMEVDLQDIYPDSESALNQMIPLQVYPAIDRDWTIALPNDLPYEDLLRAIKQNAPSILETCELLSLFSDEKLKEKGLCNVTVRMVFRDAKTTLEQHQVDSAFQEIVKNAVQRLSPFIEMLK
ncbi:MAG: phenylalanine--tRNA ligase subunit beta [Chlamydia sp.]